MGRGCARYSPPWPGSPTGFWPFYWPARRQRHGRDGVTAEPAPIRRAYRYACRRGATQRVRPAPATIEGACRRVWKCPAASPNPRSNAAVAPGPAKRFDELWRDRAYLVSVRLEFARQPVRTSARLHGDRAGGAIGNLSVQLAARCLPAPQHMSTSVLRVKEKAVLGPNRYRSTSRLP